MTNANNQSTGDAFDGWRDDVLTGSPPVLFPIDSVSGLQEKRAKGLEPSTSSLGSCEHSIASGGPQALASATSGGCTTGCTSERKNDNATAENGTADQGDTLADLAATLAKLSPADRARLVAMLTGDSPADGSTNKPAIRTSTNSTNKTTGNAKPKGKSKAKGATNGR